MTATSIHPSLLKSKTYTALSRRESGFVVQRHGSKRAFALVLEDCRRASRACYDQIDGAIVVDVREHGACRICASGESGRTGPFREGGISVVSPENTRAFARREGRACDEEIEIAVVIEIDEGESSGMIQRLNTYRSSSHQRIFHVRDCERV